MEFVACMQHDKARQDQVQALGKKKKSKTQLLSQCGPALRLSTGNNVLFSSHAAYGDLRSMDQKMNTVLVEVQGAARMIQYTD